MPNIRSRLIVNADDFGLSSEVNRGVLEAVERGSARSATIMVNMGGFDEAVSLVRDRDDVGVGLHLNITWGKPIAESSRVEALLAGDNFAKVPEINRRSRAGREAVRRAVHAECAAQIQRLLDAGIHPSHVDSHQHVHVLPGVCEGVLDACRDADVERIRRPVEPGWARSLLPKPGMWLASRVVSRWTRARASEGWGIDLLSPLGSLGISRTGSLTADYLVRLLRRMPTGTWELGCHPGGSSGSSEDRLGRGREGDLAALTDPAVAETIAALGITLCNFKDLDEGDE